MKEKKAKRPSGERHEKALNGSLMSPEQLADFLRHRFGKVPDEPGKLSSMIRELQELVVDRFRAELSPRSAKELFESKPQWQFRGAAYEGAGIRNCYKGPCSIPTEQLNFGRWAVEPSRKDPVSLILLWHRDVLEKQPSRGVTEADPKMREVAEAALAMFAKDCWREHATPFSDYQPKAGRHGHGNHWLARRDGKLISVESMPDSGPTLFHKNADKLVSFFNQEDAVYEGMADVKLKTFGNARAELWAFVGPARIAVSIRINA